MIDIPATLEAFGYDDCGKNRPVIAVCQACGNRRTTSKQNADRMCRACAALHQDRTYQRISVKTFEERAAQVMA